MLRDEFDCGNAAGVILPEEVEEFDCKVYEIDRQKVYLRQNLIFKELLKILVFYELQCTIPI